MSIFKRFMPYFGALLVLGIMVAAIAVLHRQLGGQQYRDIVASLGQIPLLRLVPAILLTVLNYLVLMGYDLLALKAIGRVLSVRQIGLASFIGTAFSNNIGLSALAGGSIRFRLYSAFGLGALDITKVLLFTTVTLWLGLIAVAGAGIVLMPEPLTRAIPLSAGMLRLVGVGVLLLPCAYLGACVRLRQGITIKGATFTPPPWRLGLFQIALSSADWILAASAMYVLLPAGSGLSYAAFLGFYLLAQLLGLVSQVPGGLGVLEATLLVLLQPYYEAGALFASLLAYRGVYYLFPLAVATVALSIRELVEVRRGVGRMASLATRWVSVLAPRYLAIITFVGGTVLLFSGATPAEAWRISWLHDVLPLPILELSHFLGSLVGLCLVLISFGLRRRLDAAYWLTLGLLCLGALVSLLKGLDWEEALILGVMLGALIPSRGYFYRRTSLLQERFEPAWIIAIVVVILSALWLSFFSFKHEAYNSSLWWSFTFNGHVSRTLRSQVAVSVVALVFALIRLLRPSRPMLTLPSSADLDAVRAIVDAHPHTYAHLALLGDKFFLFNESHKAFLMYGIAGRSWVCMGDPIGAEDERLELAWRFRELSDRHSGWPIFYEAGKENLHLYLDMGLSLLKIGEEARVELPQFTLEGKSRKGFRYIINRLEKSGACLEIAPAAAVPALLPELKAVSDTWLMTKSTREKRFSLGWFHPDYLAHCPMALIKQEGRVVAFANIWGGSQRSELSVDLMRFLPEAPDDVMEYLFLKLMLWGKDAGYSWFNLGMAPWSGLESHALAGIWNRFGAFLFQYGEHFYNFQGLRNYKEKFAPRWEPKYLVCPGGLTLPRILTNIASLVSGGIKGAFGK